MLGGWTAVVCCFHLPILRPARFCREINRFTGKSPIFCPFFLAFILFVGGGLNEMFASGSVKGGEWATPSADHPRQPGF